MEYFKLLSQSVFCKISGDYNKSHVILFVDLNHCIPEIIKVIMRVGNNCNFENVTSNSFELVDFLQVLLCCVLNFGWNSRFKWTKGKGSIAGTVNYYCNKYKQKQSFHRSFSP